jgi:putative phosphoribosyl transferase
MNKYSDRHEAGKILADNLKLYTNNPNVMILALPRGGVPVGYEISRALSVPLDIFVVRKLGVPGHEELAMGAIATNDTVIFNQEIINRLHIPSVSIDETIESEKKELKRRETAYRGNKPFPSLKDKIIILVDDGIATGATMRAAIKAVYQKQPLRLILAVPVAALSTYEEMKEKVDEIICPLRPRDFYAVGEWYDDFSQTTDDEVIQLLKH